MGGWSYDANVLQSVPTGGSMTHKPHRVNVSFSDEDYALLKYWSRKKGLSLSSFLRLALIESETYIKQQKEMKTTKEGL